jgi:3,4-dihydroxy 2-butanone 4-phosphate synthase/GTP cyclohydrolase II
MKTGDLQQGSDIPQASHGASIEAINNVLRAVETIKRGGMVIMVDDEDRENEGDLVFAAEHVCPEKINFMAREARGLICLTLDPPLVDRLKLPMMTDHGKADSARSTAFTVSIEAREGVTTGISAADRAQTVKVAICDTTTPEDLVVPGHIFPLKAKHGGVLERSGHTEGSVDIARMAGLKPAAVICEIMKDDGSMARMPDLEVFGRKHQLPIISIADLITFRLLRDSLVERLEDQIIRTSAGEMRGLVYRSIVDGTCHLALVKGADFGERCVDVRVHRERPISDVFGDEDSSSRKLVQYAKNLLVESQDAVALYLFLDGPDRTLVDDLRSLAIDPSHKNPHARSSQLDNRLYGIGAQILRDLGVQRMRLHTSTPRAFKGLAGFGLDVTESVVIE